MMPLRAEIIKAVRGIIVLATKDERDGLHSGEIPRIYLPHGYRNQLRFKKT